MKKLVVYNSLFLAILVTSCSQGQHPVSDKLSPESFSSALAKDSSAQLLDVRTPAEFSDGHLYQAKNIDWNNKDFDEQISVLDKSQPVYVYCLSGGRSAAASEHLIKKGFVKVYELEGGILQWRNSNLPETKETSSVSEGWSTDQLDSLLQQHPKVLVDFYAEWCAPCKKMAPALEALQKEMEGKVFILRIDADKNKRLVQAMKIKGLPTVMLYKNHSLIWSHEGYLSKTELESQLK